MWNLVCLDETKMVLDSSSVDVIFLGMRGNICPVGSRHLPEDSGRCFRGWAIKRKRGERGISGLIIKEAQPNTGNPPS
jgi:hypothetical protein